RKPEAAVGLRHVDHQKTELSGLLQEGGHHPFLLHLDLGDARQHLVPDELLGDLRVLVLVRPEIGKHEDGPSPDRFDQPASAMGHSAGLRIHVASLRYLWTAASM